MVAWNAKQKMENSFEYKWRINNILTIHSERKMRMTSASFKDYYESEKSIIKDAKYIYGNMNKIGPVI